MSFGEAVRTALTKKYATFSGRATRSEYWWYQLFFALCLTLLFVPILVAAAMGSDGEEPTGGARALMVTAMVLLGVFVVATIVPGLAVAIRRLHDAGYSGWMYLITLVPYVGAFVLLVLACLDSKPANKWGPNPKAPMTGSGLLPPAGWYADPSGAAQQRYWDGSSWTDHVSDQST